MRALSILLILVSWLPAQAGEILLVERARDRAARDTLLARLKRVRTGPISLEKASTRELARYMSTVAGGATSFVVMTRREISPVSLEVRTLDLVQFMGVIEAATDIRFTFVGGLVKLQHAEEVRELANLRIYDVRVATMKLPSFRAPKLGLGGVQAEQEDEESDTTVSGFTTDELVELVRRQVMPDSWDKAGISIEALNGLLFVRQTQRGHAATARLLCLLGAISVPRKPVPRKSSPRPAPTRSPKKPSS
ncbi:MAG: hypothetical protein QF412_10465 [Planctomycetota bacterium]|nr:hypothetical protein [Planctomycetota bacterium]